MFVPNLEADCASSEVAGKICEDPFNTDLIKISCNFNLICVHVKIKKQ